MKTNFHRLAANAGDEFETSLGPGPRAHEAIGLWNFPRSRKQQRDGHGILQRDLQLQRLLRARLQSTSHQQRQGRREGLDYL